MASPPVSAAATGDSRPPVDSAVALLECPICTAALISDGSRLACDNGHSSDVAKEGYVNLLPSQHRSRGIHGDVPDMLHARRRFLEAGHFSPLLDLLAEKTASLVAADTAEGAPAVIEVGCGEGYYIGGVADRVAGSAVLLGSDLSKSAAKLAAKRYPEVLFFVSDLNRRIYVRDGAAAVVLDVFAPRNPAEFARVLMPGGSVLVVIPAPAHLASVRDTFGLLDIEPDKERRVLERFADDFSLAERSALHFPLELTASATADLIGMGPNRWHGGAESVPAAVSTEAAFVLLHLERGGARSGG